MEILIAIGAFTVSFFIAVILFFIGHIVADYLDIRRLKKRERALQKEAKRAVKNLIRETLQKERIK